MPTIIDTAGASDANSYISVVNANAYFDGRLYSEVWECAKVPAKEKALITATKMLDYKYLFYGVQSNLNEQKLDWPRALVYDTNGQTVDSNIIPDFVYEATCELAISMLVENRLVDYGSKGLEKIKVGPIDIKFDETYNRNLIPDLVLEMLGPYGEVQTRDGGISVSVQRT